MDIKATQPSLPNATRPVTVSFDPGKREESDLGELQLSCAGRSGGRLRRWGRHLGREGGGRLRRNFNTI